MESGKKSKLVRLLITTGMIAFSCLSVLYFWQRLSINTKLCRAAESGDNAEVLSYLNQGANVNGRDILYFTPLISATEAHHITTVRLLLEHGASPELRHAGLTPLLIASKNGEYEIVSTLIQHGASLNARNSFGKTPLQIARDEKHEAVAALIARSGAKE